MTNEERKILVQLEDTYGVAENITDLELLSDIEAYGTLELEIGQVRFWTFNGSYTDSKSQIFLLKIWKPTTICTLCGQYKKGVKA